MRKSTVLATIVLLLLCILPMQMIPAQEIPLYESLRAAGGGSFSQMPEGGLQYFLSTALYTEPSIHDPVLLVFEEEDYEETQLRRFEIIFFISLPITLALSFAGLSAYKTAVRSWGSFETHDYAYLALSSFSLSFSVALHDNRVVFKKSGT
jgi:hypothetical protein